MKTLGRVSTLTKTTDPNLVVFDGLIKNGVRQYDPA